LNLIIDALYSFYLKVNIKALVILNKMIASMTVSLTKAKIKLEVKVYNLRIRRSAIEKAMPEHKREISKIWFYCQNPRCGIITDFPTEHCPMCGSGSLNKVTLEIPQIEDFLKKGKVCTTHPSLFSPLLQNCKTKKPPKN